MADDPRSGSRNDTVFAKGATVRLISGGPLMTVREANGETVKCDWFDNADRLRKADFFVEELKEDSKSDVLKTLLEELKMEQGKQMEKNDA